MLKTLWMAKHPKTHKSSEGELSVEIPNPRLETCLRRVERTSGKAGVIVDWGTGNADVESVIHSRRQIDSSDVQRKTAVAKRLAAVRDKVRRRAQDRPREGGAETRVKDDSMRAHTCEETFRASCHDLDGFRREPRNGSPERKGLW